MNTQAWKTAERHGARELAGDQRGARHRRERQPVEEARLDVARQVGAGARHGEDARLDERDREREGEVGVGGEAGQVGGGVQAAGVDRQQEQRERASTGTICAGWRSVRITERRDSSRTWVQSGRGSRDSRARSARVGLLLVLPGALQRAAGLGQEDVVERGRVHLQVGHLDARGSSARTTSASEPPWRASTLRPRSAAARWRSAGTASTLGSPISALSAVGRALGHDPARRR